MGRSISGKTKKKSPPGKVSSSFRVASGKKNNKAVQSKSMRESSHNSPYRCTFEAFIKLVTKLGGKLTDEHVEALKLSPFWHIINSVRRGQIELKKVKKYGCDITKVIQCYVRDKKCFDFGAFATTPVYNDVKLVFGINDGEKHLELGSFKVTDFLRRCFPEKANNVEQFDRNGKKKVMRFTPGLIAEKVEAVVSKVGGENVMDVARLLTLHLLSTLLVPSEATYFGWRYTTIVDQFAELRQYNWSSLILEVLLNGLNGNVSTQKEAKYPGCPLFLIYWICEKATLMKAHHVARLPRFRKWNLSELHKTLSVMNIRELNCDEFVERHIIASEGEVRYITDCVEDALESDDDDDCDLEEVADLDAVVTDITKTVSKTIGDRAGILNTDMVCFTGIPSDDAEVLDKENTSPIPTHPSFSLGTYFKSPKSNIARRIPDSGEVPSTTPTTFRTALSFSPEKDSGGFHVTGIEDDELTPKTGELFELTAQLVESKSLSSENMRQKELEISELQAHVHRLQNENDKLLKENEVLKAKLGEKDTKHGDVNNGVDVAGDNLTNEMVVGSVENKDHTNADLHVGNTVMEELGIGKRKRKLRKDPDFTDPTRRKPRKAKVVSDVVTVPESDDDDFAGGRKSEVHRKFTLPRINASTMEEFGNDARTKLEGIHTKDGDWSCVWMHPTKKKEPVSVNDVVNLLADKALGSNVINCWGVILNKMVGPRNKNRCMIFDSLTWSYIKGREGRNVHGECEVEKMLKKQFYNYTHLIIPLNTPRRSSQYSNPCHWTLLVLDQGACKWSHYNSMLPKGKDGHYECAVHVKKYVENAMDNVMAAEKNVPKSELDHVNDIVNVTDAPQQKDNSLDCGVLTCMLMEKVVRSHKMTASVGLLQVQKYRGKMAKTFVDDGMKI